MCAIVVNFHDATSRITMEAQRDVLLAALADVGVGIVVLDADRVQYPNDAFCRMMGYAADALTRKTFQEITHPDDLDVDLHVPPHAVSGQRGHAASQRQGQAGPVCQR